MNAAMPAVTAMMLASSALDFPAISIDRFRRVGMDGGVF